MTRTEIRSCSACSGAVVYDERPELISWVGNCQRCGGLHIIAPTRVTACRFVRLDQPMQDDCESPRYFDVEYGRRRVHGWYDPKSKRVVQFG